MVYSFFVSRVSAVREGVALPLRKQGLFRGSGADYLNREARV